MDFESFCEEYKPKNENQKKSSFGNNNPKVNFDKKTDFNEEYLKEKIEKYKSYDNEQLLSELLKEVNKQKKNGNLTDKKISDIYGGLSPFLDESQKQKLNDIIKMLR